MDLEQQLNVFGLVKELGLAVEMRLDHRQRGDEVVIAEKRDGAIRCVMKHDSMVRKVKEKREMSRRAMMEGGSSSNFLGRLDH
ncbi:Anthocyanidin 3-O-glucosyltransferase 1 [Vitis vinifera]|uniref:Anthocyanidin 3-O-glucosyltransferase 1 n=1 Tax=Vitis vinifera TaxID=29760 RepID=A0A438F9X1_VITVI|nr:Anthocyanidin 3-O-glucosyltransferase 1 [Vitis vinifera]